MPHERFLLAAVLASPQLAVMGASLDGTISTWSVGAAQLYGWTEEEAVGQPLTMLAPADRLEEVLALYEAVASEQEPAPVESVRLAKDGSLIPVEAHAFIVRDDAGQPLGMAAVHRDLRRARRAELALSGSVEELRARYLGSPVAQSRVDLDGRILSVNAAMERLLGRPAAELVGTDALELYVEADREGVATALARLAAGSEAHVRQEWALRRPEGELVPVIVTISAMRDPDGNVVLAGSVEDVTALREAERHIRTEAERLDALLASMPVAAFSYDREGVCTWARGLGLSRAGITEQDLLGVCLLELYAHDPHIVDALRVSLAGGEARTVMEQAGRIWESHYRALCDEAGDVVGGLGIGVDVTELTHAERDVRANEARMRALLRKSGDVVVVVDGEGRLLWVSPAVERVLGHDPTDLFWSAARDLTHPDDVMALAAAWHRVRTGEGAGDSITCRMRLADGTYRWFDCTLTDLVDDPDVGGVVLNLRDVTERRAAERELQRVTLHDPMTGLPNRLLLLDRVAGAMSRAKAQDRQTGLVLLEVVGMGQINDSLGHDVGDVVLCSVAGRLLESAGEGDSVARIGGDEFAVLIDEVASTEELRARTAALVDDVRGRLDLGDVVVDVQVRAGSALTPATSAGALLSTAERSLNRRDGETAVVAAQAAVEQDDGAALELRRAIEQGELRLHYQPVVRIDSGELAGAEALVRWQHPQRGLLPPLEFIPLAEASGLVVQLGEWVLREACRQAAEWRTAGRPVSVSVNLSPVQLVGGAFPILVRRVLDETGLPPDRLVLEVTESALMDDPSAPRVLRTVAELGVRLALDDFGTGYSSMTYLKRFPVDAIKIDRSFVAGLGQDTDDEAIVASIVSLGRTIGKKVVPEGVETVGQLDVLCTMGADFGQGYLWSKPVDAAAFERWREDSRQLLAVHARPSPAAPPERSDAGTAHGDEARILALHGAGASLHTIAAALNVEGRRTPTGSRWTTRTVARVVADLSRAVST